MTDIENSFMAAVKAYLPDNVEVAVQADGGEGNSNDAFKVRVTTNLTDLQDIFPVIENLVYGDGALLAVDDQMFIVDTAEDQPYLVIKEELGRASTRFIRYSQPDDLPKRCECSCPCHVGAITHIVACCIPDTPDADAAEVER